METEDNNINDPTTTTFGSSTSHNYYYDYALILGGTTALISILLSGGLMVQHRSCWTRPAQQQKIVQIIFLAPLFALAAFVGLLELSVELEAWAHGLDMIKECYEAVAIHAFLLLMLELCGLSSSSSSEMHGQGKAVSTIPENIKGRELHLPFPISLVYGGHAAHLDVIWIQRLKRWTLQFVIVRPVLSLLDLLFVDLYPIPEPFHTILSISITIGLNVSVTFAFFALITFYHALEHELAPFRPLAKFACIKGVVFFATWQGLLLKVLAHPNIAILHEGYRFSVDEIGAAWHDFLVCVEMGLLFSPLHTYAFPPKEYRASSATTKDTKTKEEKLKEKKES